MHEKAVPWVNAGTTTEVQALYGQASHINISRRLQRSNQLKRLPTSIA
jgi:hypothetical protein